MRKLLRLATSLLVLAILFVFSYYYVTHFHTSRFAACLTVTVILIVPLTSISYVFFRLEAREVQLKNLFTLHGILIAYLNSKGENVSKKQGESDDQYHERLKRVFNSIFETEMRGEYGRTQYFFGVLVASGVTGLVLHYLATSSLGAFLAGTTTALITPVQVGLLGAFAWNLWLLLNSYDKLDLPPSTFYWMPFRYVVGIVSGLFANQVFKSAEFANIFALVVSAIPYPTLLGFLRDKIADKISVFKEAHAGHPPIWKIQGMPQDTIDRLAALGIRTTQELAYSDPLMLLFRTNFQPKIVIDWIDQCLAYDYFGDQLGDDITLLRVRGIRGSIELSGLKDNDLALPEIAKILKVTPDELKYFRDKLLNDYQLKLISTLWDQFQPQQSPPPIIVKSLAPLGGPVSMSITPAGLPPGAKEKAPEESVATETTIGGSTHVSANVPVESTRGNGEGLIKRTKLRAKKNLRNLFKPRGES